MIDLQAKPFYLTKDQCAWVEKTRGAMSREDKIAQLFCLTDVTTDTAALAAMVARYRPGAFMYRAGRAAEIRAAHEAMQKASKIPMLLAANLESGGNGVAVEGTYFGKEMEVAASGDAEMARALGEVCGREGAAVGCNWAFAPIVDIDKNWRNPITNVRTFGSDPAVVAAMGAAYRQGVQDSGAAMAVCIKHFPGDGVDERDQHLLSSVNSLSADAWEASYGKVYRSLIDAGAETLMAGHILQPAMTRRLCPGIRDEEILPGSTNKYLLTDLLRGQMGFNGLISTDATPMAGFANLLPRKKALQTALAAGVDMLLFCKDIGEDYAAIREGLDEGVIPAQRLDDAVTRILATKAHLRLPERAADGTLVPSAKALDALGCAQHRRWASECADKAVTLVKDNAGLLPLSPAKTPRIRLTVLGEKADGAFGDNDSIAAPLKEALEQAGFAVSLYDYATMERGEIFTAGVAAMRDKFDLSLIAANVATGSNNTTRRLDWIPLMAANEPWYAREIPTVFVSFANPYHMIDVPFISTFVNAYSSNRFSVQACVDKLTGKSSFQGKSPVDAFCGGIWGADFQ